MAKLGKILLYLLAIGVSASVIGVYVWLPLGEATHPDIQRTFLMHPAVVYAHVFGAAVALLLGPCQFSSRLRRGWPQLHRWMGRAYLGIGVLIGGLSGLYLAAYAYGGMIPKLGFAVLAVLWLFTGAKAFAAVRSRAFSEHRKWMVRNFALTFAAVTLRLYLPTALVAGLRFEDAYPAIAWLCWVPNLIIAELAFNRCADHATREVIAGQSSGKSLFTEGAR